jgi:CheY-like chemotaxis protein
LTHHDPLRDDDALDHVVEDIRSRLSDTESPLKVTAAIEGEIVEVQPSHAEAAQRPSGEFRAMTPMGPALTNRSIILNIADSRIAAALSDVIRAEGIRANFFSSIDEARELIAEDRPSLVILKHDAAHIDAIKMCRAIRQMEDDPSLQPSVVMIAAQRDPTVDAASGPTDWLIKPFTNSYARTKIRAWMLRTACNWIRATVPDNEERRLAALRGLRILDTEPEERFDRVTRLAAALFDVPIAVISLVDENRQWFKSCVGLNARETSRDASFCAHVVYNQTPMIVADTFKDARFADNPLVTNEPRIRFYAGYPLTLNDGTCIGTLCLLDSRPRSLEMSDLEQLRDLADIALQELAA